MGQLTGEFLTINPAQLFLRNISILSAKGVSRSQLADALDLVARRRIKPAVDRVYPLEGAAEAHRAGRSGSVDRPPRPHADAVGSGIA